VEVRHIVGPGASGSFHMQDLAYPLADIGSATFGTLHQAENILILEYIEIN